MNDPNAYWFPAKRYGWGWGPPTAWQGWMVLIVWAAVFTVGIFVLRLRGFSVPAHIVWAIAMSLVLVVICYLKGEPPRWRWGDRSP
jgi:hypothetical protein